MRGRVAAAPEPRDQQVWTRVGTASTFRHGDHNSTSDTARSSRSKRQRAFAR